MANENENEISFGGSREEWLDIEKAPVGFAIEGDITKTDVQITLKNKKIPLFWIQSGTSNQCINGYSVQWADAKERKLSELKGLHVVLTKLTAQSKKFMCTVKT